jgi:hypothetical protein
MIYLFAGDDSKRKNIALEDFTKSLPFDMATFYISRNNFNPDQIESLYSGASLFSAVCSVVFSNILEKEDHRDFVLGKLEEMATSPNFFIFIESKLNKATLDAFKEARAELNIFELSKEAKEKFNNFLLADAFGNRDKLNLWIYYRQAVDKGVGLEELVGVLFWKIKDMILKKNFYKFKEEELKNISSKLSYLLPEARKDGRDAEAALEAFLLEAF